MGRAGEWSSSRTHQAASVGKPGVHTDEGFPDGDPECVDGSGPARC